MQPLWLVKMSLQRIQKISQGYCIHLPNLKEIHRTVTELWGKENAELTQPAETDILPIYKQASLAGRLNIGIISILGVVSILTNIFQRGTKLTQRSVPLNNFPWNMFI